MIYTFKNLIKEIIPPSILNFYHFSLPLLGAFLYRFPSRKIKVIGITGTCGKSSVVNLCVKILEEADYKVASVSSIKFKIGEYESKNTLKMTMPGRMKMQRFLRKAVNAGCDYAVLEITSEGIKQFRHKFIDFDVAVFTNLSPEHIEHHGGFENYKKEKGKLFQSCGKTHIINLDDEHAEYFLKFPANKKIGFQMQERRSPSSSVRSDKLPIVEAKNCEVLENGVKFSVENTEFELKLLGEFNIYNALTAISIAKSQNIKLKHCKSALEKVKGIKGRMEIVIRKPFTVIVDYAHTPDALEKVYKTVKSLDNKLICVLGAAGGGRDKWKRPELGKIASQYCDKIILTNEDPYSENPEKILEEIETGFLQTANYEKILDRQGAIRSAISSALYGDTIIITGKGSEPWMCLANGKKVPWDDKKIVEQVFQR
jgi:UDP-N-acetylmuramoyl-L-alanyl-D-glutamate--2,6-diaminopimelate ligase